MKRMSSQRGQALILIALAAVGLFGFAALAIDGSRAFSDKRHAQNTADTSVLSAALAHIKEPTEADKFIEAKKAALLRAASNGYNNDGMRDQVIVELCSATTISGRSCEGLPAGADPSKFIRVYIISNVPTTFARIIGRATIQNGAEAIAMVTGTTSTSTVGGGRYGLQTLKSSCGNPPTLHFTGSGDVSIQGSVGNNSCFDSSGSGDFHVTGDVQNGGDFKQTGSGDWIVEGNVWVGKYSKSGSQDWQIIGEFFTNSTFNMTGSGDFAAGSLIAVGSATESGSGNVSPPLPATPGAYEAPLIIDDPYATVLQPPINPGSCTAVSHGGASNVTLNPGCYTSVSKVGSGTFTLNPGIYYILGNFNVSGSAKFVANGVLLYMKGGALEVTGSGGVSISPLTSDPYKGLSIYVDRSNNKPVSITGSGGSSFSGTVYAPASAFTLTGSGGTFVVDSQILSWTAELTGSGNLNLVYDPANNYNPGGPGDPTIQLIK